jgi:hypothetical protein
MKPVTKQQANSPLVDRSRKLEAEYVSLVGKKDVASQRRLFAVRDAMDKLTEEFLRQAL